MSVLSLAFARVVLFALALLGMAVSPAARAAVEIKGAKFEETYQVANQTLRLNGVGIRTWLILDVYAAGLYLPKKEQSTAAILAQPGAKSLQVVMLRDLTGKEFAEAMIKGFKANHSEAELAKYEGKLNEVKALMMDFGSVKKGTTIHIDLVPGVGTRIMVDGVKKGPDVAGEEFYGALLLIWLGNHPVDADLKDALLGGK